MSNTNQRQIVLVTKSETLVTTLSWSSNETADSAVSSLANQMNLEVRNWFFDQMAENFI
jgi:hypothetical protein